MSENKVNKILVSQPRPASEKSPYFDMEAEYGVSFDFKQLIRVVGLTAKEFRTQHINPLDYTAVLFNSRLGIDHYFRLMEEMRLQVPESMHYYCISEAIANYLQKYIQYRKRKVFFGPNNKFEDVIPAMNRRPTEKYLMVLSDVHNDDVLNMFASHNITIQPAIFYRTEAVPFTQEELNAYDMYVLFTPTGVSAFKQNMPDFEQGNKVFACFGASTAAAIKAEGWRLDIEAPTPDCPSITAAIEKYLAQQQKEESSQEQNC